MYCLLVFKPLLWGRGYTSQTHPSTDLFGEKVATTDSEPGLICVDLSSIETNSVMSYPNPLFISSPNPMFDHVFDLSQ